MARRFRQQVDDEILDRAAALFAQHGFDQTSLKSLADAVGLSKAGLLHHYPSKEALYEAARVAGRDRGRSVLEQLEHLPPGRERDRRALELVTDLALDRPGWVALAFSSFTTPDAATTFNEQFDEQTVFVAEMFAIDLDGSDPERFVRVVGALSAMAVLSLAANRKGEKTTWRPHIIATCFDALGHSRPDASSSSSHQVEA
ncbi:TetR/AcrR family transcriptional regulator [Saccharothrix deserti]|uniref:TetR/AcrR family transcriptional regulator n=1 Tax=Saccharothrix deserti TaxID=2593674 RepID=UPI00131C384A|nr:TetR/AcrR family transcriptional regulator [Saccharothrix deserti]